MGGLKVAAWIEARHHGGCQLDLLWAGRWRKQARRALLGHGCHAQLLHGLQTFGCFARPNLGSRRAVALRRREQTQAADSRALQCRRTGCHDAAQRMPNQMHGLPHIEGIQPSPEHAGIVLRSGLLSGQRVAVGIARCIPSQQPVRQAASKQVQPASRARANAMQ